MSRPALFMYVIYLNTSDHPGFYVVRKWEVGTTPLPRELVGHATTLEEARKAIPPDLYRLPRNPLDDQCIVEVWL